MVDAISSASSYATSAIAAADVQIAAVAGNIANQIDSATPPTGAVFGSSAVAAPPVTGTRPSNAASQVFQALQTGTSTSNGVAPAVSRSGAYDISYRPDSPSADAQGLVARPAVDVQSPQATGQVNHRLLDLTT